MSNRLTASLVTLSLAMLALGILAIVGTLAPPFGMCFAFGLLGTGVTPVARYLNPPPSRRPQRPEADWRWSKTYQCWQCPHTTSRERSRGQHRCAACEPHNISSGPVIEDAIDAAAAAVETVFGPAEPLPYAETLGTLRRLYEQNELSSEQFVDCSEHLALLEWALAQPNASDAEIAALGTPENPRCRCKPTGGPDCSVCFPSNPLRDPVKEALLAHNAKELEALKGLLVDTDTALANAAQGYPISGHQQGDELAVLRRRLHQAYTGVQSQRAAIIGHGIKVEPSTPCGGCARELFSTDTGVMREVTYCDGSHARIPSSTIDSATF